MLDEFLKEFKSCTISTIDESSNPFSSYAPFIKDNGKFYIYISQMAKHTKNIENSKKVSLLFIKDESSSNNIFARKRVVYQCDTIEIQRDDSKFNTILDRFEVSHGEIVSMLRGMLDFKLFEITPFYGEAVFGFGEAYTISGESFDKLIPRGGSGHKTK